MSKTPYISEFLITMVVLQYSSSKIYTQFFLLLLGIEWFLQGTGPAATTHLEAGAFIRSRPGIEHPDIQYHFLVSNSIEFL